jgi:hypothetical protein
MKREKQGYEAGPQKLNKNSSNFPQAHVYPSFCPFLFLIKLLIELSKELAHFLKTHSNQTKEKEGSKHIKSILTGHDRR